MPAKPIRTRDVPRREGELIKPGEIVAVEGVEGWTLAERRIWNLLLVNAWSDRLEDPAAEFIIPLAELRGNHDSNDRLRASLRKLQTTLVSARLPNGRTRTVQMLGGADLDDDDRTEGQLAYEFSKKLVPLLRDSEIYARMEVKVLSAFTSKYSLHLYEALAARVNLRKTAETLDLAALRQLARRARRQDGALARPQAIRRGAGRARGERLLADRGRGRFGQTETQGHRGQDVMVQEEALQPRRAGRRPRGQPPQHRPQGPDHGRGRAGCRRRCRACIEGVPELPAGLLQRTRDAVSAETGVRLDIHAAHADWQNWVAGMKEPVRSPAGHFVDFCKRRAKELK